MSRAVRGGLQAAAGALRRRAHVRAGREGIIPAPEPSHEIAAVVEEAKRWAETGESKVILAALCGHGHFDMVAYERYLSGEMTDFELPQDRIDAALASLPPIPGA